MLEVKARGEIFVSKILGKKIFDGAGQKVGRIRDLAVLWDGAFPRVVGTKYTKGSQKIICVSEFNELSRKGLFLKHKMEQTKTKELQENELLVKKWLLDKQIVDIKGSKLVRVNDIQLSLLKRNDTFEVILSAVDVGVRGLIRRITGYEPITGRLPSSLVGWQYLEPIRTRTANLKLSEATDKFSLLHPADIAEIIEELDYYERPDFIRTLDNQTAAEALGEVDLGTQVNIIKRLDNERVSKILVEMAPDEAADLLGELTQEQSDELLSLMEPEEAEDVRELMEYPDDTAGALMTTEFITLSLNMTAQEAINRIRETAQEAEIIYYLYVLDENEKLLGVLSLRELIMTQPVTSISQIMQERVITVLADDVHRDVLDTIVKYDLIAVPVVDQNGCMLGIITVGDALGIVVPDRKNLESFSYYMVRKAFGKRYK
ncbi:MAG: CBS domain-containing protein [Desulfotomaculaceae bacterium]|nr:CBS domain-containing protein [Desulfotomaculaceae bacterium]